MVIWADETQIKQPAKQIDNYYSHVTSYYSHVTRTDRIDSSLQHGCRDIECSLRSNVPIPAHVGSVDEHYPLAPTLRGECEGGGWSVSVWGERGRGGGRE